MSAPHWKYRPPYKCLQRWFRPIRCAPADARLRQESVPGVLHAHRRAPYCLLFRAINLRLELEMHADLLAGPAESEPPAGKSLAGRTGQEHQLIDGDGPEASGLPI